MLNSNDHHGRWQQFPAPPIADSLSVIGRNEKQAPGKPGVATPPWNQP